MILNDAITAAETLYNSITDNDDYTDIASTLKTKIDAAQAVADNDDADQDTVDEATTALNTALTEVAAIKTVIDEIKNLPGSDEVNPSDSNQKAAINKASEDFDAYKDTKKTDVETMKDAGDTTEANALITAAKDEIDGVSFDPSKTLDENKAVIDDIIKQLTTDLSNQRAADAVSAKINALPPASDVTTNDKVAINEARDAYDDLTAKKYYAAFE